MRHSKHHSTWFWLHCQTPRFSARSVLTIIVLFSVAPGAHGQETAGKDAIQNLEKNPVPLPTPQPHPKYEISAAIDYSWVGSTGFSDNNADSRNSRGQRFPLGNIGEQDIFGKLDLRVPITDSLAFTTEASYKGFFFNLPQPKAGTKPMIPLRSQLEEIEVGVGLRYRYSDKLTLFGEVSGRIASDFVSLNSNDLGIGGKIGLRYAPCGNDSLYYILGVAAESNSNQMVIPAVGVHWEPNDRWTFNLVFPEPEVDFHLNSRITMFANAEGVGGTFRVGTNVGTHSLGPGVGSTKFNNALLDYSEVRVGGGIRLQLLKNVRLETEAGSTVYRNFEYIRFGQQTSPNNAPFVQTSLKILF
jgi:hypothetical protein